MTNYGTIFVGQQMKEYAESCGIKMLISTPYYAQINRQVEATNKVITTLIKKYVGQYSGN